MKGSENGDDDKHSDLPEATEARPRVLLSLPSRRRQESGFVRGDEKVVECEREHLRVDLTPGADAFDLDHAGPNVPEAHLARTRPSPSWTSEKFTTEGDTTRSPRASVNCASSSQPIPSARVPKSRRCRKSCRRMKPRPIPHRADSRTNRLNHLSSMIRRRTRGLTTAPLALLARSSLVRAPGAMGFARVRPTVQDH
mgnify:CR=1 FL=1